MLSSGSKRALRTAYQSLLAAVTGIPVIIALLPVESWNSTTVSAALTGVLAWCAIVSKIINAFEDRGWIPAWLRDDLPTTVGKHQITD